MRTIVSSCSPALRRLGSLLVLGGLLAGISSAQAQANKQADDARLNANGLYGQRLYQIAVSEYQAFLKKWPTDPHAVKVRFGLGAAHFNLKQYAQAEAVMGKVVGDPKCPDVPQANFIWGQSLLKLKKPANAEGAFETGIKGLPKPKTKPEAALLADLKAGRLEALYQQKKWKDVVAASAALKGKAGKGSTRVAYQGAFALFKLEKYQDAGTAFADLKPAVKDTPLQQQAHYLLGECLRKQNQFPAAIKEFEVAAGLKGLDAPEALFRLSILHFNLENFKDAAQNFDDYRVKYRGQVGPERFADARIFLGRSLVELKQFKQAEKVFGDLAADPKAGAKVFLWQGRMWQSQKKYAAAVKVLGGALEKFPASGLIPDLLFDFANNNLGLNQFKEAGAAFDKLRQEQPKFKQMAVLLHLNAVCKHNIRDYANSLKLCGEFLAAYAKHERAVDVTFLQCENHFFLNDHPRAIAGYQAFAEAHPKDLARVNLAKMRVGRSESELKQWAKVLAVLEPLLEAKVKGPEFDQLEYLVAESYYRQDNWAKAVEMCLLFAETKPKSTNADTALLMAGLASEKLAKRTEAIAAYQELEKSHPESVQLAPARVRLGVLFYAWKKYPQAKAALQKVAAIQKHTLRPEAEYWLAWVEVSQGNFAVAAQQFGALTDGFPQHDRAADGRLQQGMMLIKAEQFPSAQAALTKFLADYAAHQEIDQATYHIGFAQMKQKQWEPALASFAKVPAKSDWKDDALYQSAWCEKSAGHQAQAALQYTALLKDFPESPLANNATLELAEINFDVDKLDDVIKSLTAMIARKPEAKLLARARYRLGWAHFDQKDWAAGAKAFEAMLATAPEDLLVTAAWQAGECRWNIKEHAEALANFQKAVAAKKPEEKEKAVLHEQALLRVGQCQDQLGKWQDAEATFKKFIAAHPQHDHIRAAHHGLGGALKGQKKYPEALAEFELVVSKGIRDELGAQSQFLIGECHLEQNKFSKAIAEYSKVELLYKYPVWQSKAIFEMAQALDKNGDKDSAKAQYQRLIDKYPDTDAAKAAKARLP